MAPSLTAKINSFYFGLTFNRYTLLPSHPHLVICVCVCIYAVFPRLVIVILRKLNAFWFCFCYLQRKRKSLLNTAYVHIFFMVFSAAALLSRHHPLFGTCALSCRYTIDFKLNGSLSALVCLQQATQPTEFVVLVFCVHKLCLCKALLSIQVCMYVCAHSSYIRFFKFYCLW